MSTKKLKIMHVAETKSDCEKLISETKEALSKLSTEIIVKASGVRETKFPDFRSELYISKVKGIAWRHYYQAINSVKPVPFDLI